MPTPAAMHRPRRNTGLIGLLAAVCLSFFFGGLKAGDPRKVLLAAVLSRQTSVGQAWIAEALGMKSAANVSLLLHRSDWEKVGKQVPEELSRFAKMQEYAH